MFRSTLGHVVALAVLIQLAVVDPGQAADLPEDLEMKLSSQFDRFDQGRAFLVDRIVTQNGRVNRSEWEEFLMQDNETLVISEADKEALRDFHGKLMEEAAAAAEGDSSISIDSFRDDKEKVEKFCSDFPRVALLHIHPSGTVKRETALQALETINPTVDTEALIAVGTGELTTLYPSEMDYLESLPLGQRYLDYSPQDQEKIADFLFLPVAPCCHDFPRFEALFDIHDIFFEQSEENATYFTELTYKDFLERNKAFGIQYVEFTRVRIPATADNLISYDQYLLEKATEYEMHLNYNSAFVRTLDAEVNAGFASNFIQALENNASDLSTLVGIDLLAEENGNPTLEKAQTIYVPIWNAWQNEGRIELGGMTMHAGEHSIDYGPENVRDAIIMGATRIGHGVLLYEDPIILEYNRRKQIPLVNNIASNWRLNVIENDDFDNHRFIELIRVGIPLTFSTDDEGMFHTDIVNECVLAIENSDIQYSELREISYTSVTASFADDSFKEELLTELDAKFEAFEKEYAVTTSTTATSSTVTLWGGISIALLWTPILVTILF